VGGATALTDESNLVDARESAACRCNIRLLKTWTPDKHVDVCVESDEDRGSTPLASSLAFGAHRKSEKRAVPDSRRCTAGHQMPLAESKIICIGTEIKLSKWIAMVL
jgi:hypothetical protein